MTRKAEEQWGAGVVEQLSMDLQAAFPESKEFSTSNLWRMKQWYLFYAKSAEKLAQLGREIIEVPSAADDAIPFPDYFAFVPWKHHVEIVTKCKSVEEAILYVMKCINEGWSRHTLENCLHAHYFESCGGAITNFSEKLPSPQSEMAQEITKDTYDFGFISLEDGYKEETLETELERQLTRFMLELGTGFPLTPEETIDKSS